jgi:hypothetical protein
MKLGVLSEKGKLANAKAKKALDFLSQNYGITYIPMKDDSVSRIDGFFCKEDYSNEHYVSSIYEIKTRNGKVEDDEFHFEGKKYDTQLIAYQKILDGQRISNDLNLPFVLIVVFYNYIYIWKITNELIKESTIYQSITLDNINGGIANRNNCYLPFKLATLKIPYNEV